MVVQAFAVSIRPNLAEKTKRLDSGDRAINEELEKGLLVLIEPDLNVREALTLLLQSKGWAIRAVSTCEELSAAIGQDGLTAVISESTLPSCTAQDILELCSAQSVPVVFTGHDLPLQGAVDLIRQGAMDFLDKPFPQARLLDLLERLSNRQNG
jgi:two-component system C4-dicarboxylate transport response regulator DctD